MLAQHLWAGDRVPPAAPRSVTKTSGEKNLRPTLDGGTLLVNPALGVISNPTCATIRDLHKLSTY